MLASVCLLGLFVSLLAVPPFFGPYSMRFDAPSVISAAEAAYPLNSISSGTVVLEVTLESSGAISDVRVVRGIPSLTEAAERSIRQWKFRPAQLNGESVRSKIAVAFSFVPPGVGPRA
jgi:TonB family protein